MSSTQNAQPGCTPKRRGCGTGCLVVLLSSFLLLGVIYWGYCWGWWGRNNLTLQYLFQCQCPAASEEVRYRPFTVLASACTHPHLRDTAPSGHYTIIEEERPIARIIRHDLLQGRTQDLGLQPAAVTRTQHLNDHLLFIRRRDRTQSSLLDLQEGRQIPIPFVQTFTLDPTIKPVFQAAEQVLVFNVYILALAPDYLAHPDQNVVLYTISRESRDQVTQQLTAAGIAFTEVPDPYTTGPVRDAQYAHDGRLYALPDGVYRAATQERLIELAFPRTPPEAVFHPVGWTPDNRRVVYTRWPRLHLIDVNYVDWRLFPVPQPILLLEVPEAYWAADSAE